MLFTLTMKNIYLAFAFILLASTAHAQTLHSLTKSAVTFEIKNLGIKTGGSIGGLKADIKFDPADLNKSKIEASIDATSINTDNTLRDEHLRGDNYFNTAVYPKILMTSTGFKSKGGNSFIGLFDITIKNKTKPVTVPFTYSATGNAATFKGNFKINRRDFGVGGNSMTLGDEVTILLTVETVKQ